ncbi:MAG: hypothetical protein KKA07_14975 [Bacteroidetes bacterium]|nr:hypothetical protein [Bacteroidota bacterium]MBU1720364.1 hypothetical protein [Bacteroidota bacterium]
MTTASWNYSPNTKNEGSKASAKTVYLKQFEDKRPSKNNGSAYLAWIPTFPFGWINWEKPEEKSSHLVTTTWKFNPAEDFTQALLAELRISGLFKDAKMCEGNEKSGVVIEGTIKSTQYKAKLFYYGITPFAAYWIHLLGAPEGSFKNEIRIELICKEAKSGEILFSKEYAKYFKKTYWIYGIPKTDFVYDQILKEIYAEFFVDLKNSKVL